MSIGKITMNELSDSLRTYLENLDTSTVEMNSLVISEAIDDTDDKNDCLNKVIKDNGDIIYICPTGKTISSVTLNWEINKTTDITSASIAIKQKDSAYTTLVYGNDAIEVISSGNYTISNVALTNNTTIKIIVTYNSNGISKSFTKYLTLYFYNPLLYGKVKYTGEEKDSEGNTISSFIEYINTKEESFVNINSVFVYWADLNMTFNINCKKDEYEYITFMLPLTNIRFFINGLNGGIDRVGNWTYNGTTFYVFKSNQPCLGNCEVTIKRVNTTSTTSDD